MATVNLCWSGVSDVWFTDDGVYTLASGDNASFPAAVCVRNARITSKASQAISACEAAGAAGQVALEDWVRTNVRSSSERHDFALFGGGD